MYVALRRGVWEKERVVPRWRKGDAVDNLRVSTKEVRMETGRRVKVFNIFNAIASVAVMMVLTVVIWRGVEDVEQGRRLGHLRPATAQSSVNSKAKHLPNAKIDESAHRQGI